MRSVNDGFERGDRIGVPLLSLLLVRGDDVRFSLVKIDDDELRSDDADADAAADGELVAEGIDDD
jgi:hypothetical protein